MGKAPLKADRATRGDCAGVAADAWVASAAEVPPESPPLDAMASMSVAAAVARIRAASAVGGLTEGLAARVMHWKDRALLDHRLGFEMSQSARRMRTELEIQQHLATLKLKMEQKERARRAENNERNIQWSKGKAQRDQADKERREAERGSRKQELERFAKEDDERRRRGLPFR